MTNLRNGCAHLLLSHNRSSYVLIGKQVSAGAWSPYDVKDIAFNARDVNNVLTSVAKLFRKLPIIRDVASERDVSHTVGKLLKFPVRRCKFLRLNLREIAATR